MWQRVNSYLKAFKKDFTMLHKGPVQVKPRCLLNSESCKSTLLEFKMKNTDLELILRITLCQLSLSNCCFNNKTATQNNQTLSHLKKQKTVT